jgi:hypothetical protein
MPLWMEPGIWSWKYKTETCLGHVLPGGSQVDGVGSVRLKLAWVMSSLEGAR